MPDSPPIDDAVTLFYDLSNSVIVDHIPLARLKRRPPPCFDKELQAALKDEGAAHRRTEPTRTLDTDASFRDKSRVYKQLASSMFCD